MSVVDPFTQVYKALWELAAGFTPFTDLVRLRSRINFAEEGNRAPIKHLIASGDLPEVVLIPAGGVANLHATTTTSTVTKRYTWLISTGDLRVEEGKLFPVEFALVRAMCNWQSTVCALTWNGDQFAKRCDLLDVNEGESDAERNRGIAGWSAVWSCEVEMHFSTRLLKNED